MGEPVEAIICGWWSEEQLMALPGNRTTSCEVCSEPLVISREGRRLKAEKPDAKILCARCAVRTGPDARTRPVPGAAEAVQEAGYRPLDWNELSERRLADVVDDEGQWK